MSSTGFRSVRSGLPPPPPPPTMPIIGSSARGSVLRSTAGASLIGLVSTAPCVWLTWTSPRLFAKFCVVVLTGCGLSTLTYGWRAKKCFGSLSVYVVSPFDLAGPYPVGHGGAQGGGMGVGLFGAAGVMRTTFKGGVLCQGLSWSLLCPLRVGPLALYPTLPWNPSGLCSEVVLNDERTLLGRPQVARDQGRSPNGLPQNVDRLLGIPPGKP